MKWPETVPMPLTGKDFCQLAYDGPDDTHCLMGWARRVFGEHTSNRKTVMAKLMEICNRKSGDYSVIVFSDTHDGDECAVVWNEAMESMVI